MQKFIIDDNLNIKISVYMHTGQPLMRKWHNPSGRKAESRRKKRNPHITC